MAIESAEEFVRLRFSADADEYGRAAHESASTQVWRDVIEQYPDARVWVAQNKTVPLEILEIIALDPDPRVRVMVAMKRKATARLLSTLATDSDESVRMAVARHRRTSRETLESLRNDPWDQIRMMVAQRLEKTGNDSP